MKMDAFNTYMSNIPTDFFKSLCLKYGSAYTYKKGNISLKKVIYFLTGDI